MSSLLNAEWPEMKAVKSAEANLFLHCILQQSCNKKKKKATVIITVIERKESIIPVSGTSNRVRKFTSSEFF